jgi:hypothetical protein
MRKSLIRNALQDDRKLAKVDVASSSLVTRSLFLCHSRLSGILALSLARKC